MIAALRMVVSLANFWLRRGYAAEGIHWTTEALRLEECSPKDTDEKAGRERMHIRARALQALSFLHYSQGDNPGAVEAGEECIPLARQVGDLRLLSICLAFTGSAKGFLGETEGALAYLEEAVSLARRHGKGFELGIALRTLATLIGIAHGDFKTAEAYEAEAFALAKGNADNWWGSTMSLVTSARRSSRRLHPGLHYLIECLPFRRRAICTASTWSAASWRTWIAEGHREAAAAYRKPSGLGWPPGAVAPARVLASSHRAGEVGGRCVCWATNSLREKINIPMYPAEG
jgi:tetratricopeptide (TPR) repeat protein